MKKCPTCSFENPDDSKFCNSCGKDISQSPRSDALIRCPKCSNLNPPGTSFCNSCGQPLTQAAADRLARERQISGARTERAKDHPSYGQFTAISILLPPVGFIIGIVSLCKNKIVDKKLGEHAIATSLLWGLIFWPVLFFIFTSCTSGNKKTDLTTSSIRVTASTTGSTIFKTSETTATQAPTETSTLVIDINIEDLLAAYDENEIAAQKKYDGKILRVTGIVDSIGENVLNEVFVTIGDGSNEWNTLYCTFKSEMEINKVATLKKGDTISIVGKAENGALTLYLKNCSVESIA